MAKLPFIARLKFIAARVARHFNSSWNEIERQVAAAAVTDSGESVTALTAMQTTAVYACVRVLSEIPSTLPLHLHTYADRGQTTIAVAREHYLDALVHWQPNPEQTIAEYLEMVFSHWALRGNSYSIIDRDPLGRVSSMFPVHPSLVTPKRYESGGIYYEIRYESGRTAFYPANRILHYRNLSDDGLIGLGPLQLARNAIGGARSTERYASRFFANNGRPSGVLKTDSQISTDPEKSKAIKEQIRSDWMAMVAGERQHGVAILDQGLGWQEVGVAPEDAQMLETRKYNAIDIARVFRVPPHKIGALDRATWGNIESQAIEFVTDTIRPMLTKYEQALNRSLLLPAERGRYFFKFNLNAILRGDMKTRYEAYSIGRNGGWLSANDIRRLEDMNPIDGGDEYLSPLNMTPAGSREAPAAPEDSEDGPNLTRRAIAYANHLRSNGNGHQV